MDKEKQIEEIKQVINEHYHNGNIARKKSLAEKIYDKIITDNEIVISKEEYKTYLAMKSIETNLVEIEKDKARKETAREILNEFVNVLITLKVGTILNKLTENAISKSGYLFAIEQVKELAEKYGVSLGELEKENG